MSSTNLKPNQLKAISMLVAGQSAKAVAEQVGVTPETVSRWRNNDHDFMAALNSAQAALHEESRDLLRSLAADALGAIKDSLSPSTPAKTRLDAAKFVFESLEIAQPGHVAVGPDDPTEVKRMKYLEREAEAGKLAKHMSA